MKRCPHELTRTLSRSPLASYWIARSQSAPSIDGGPTRPLGLLASLRSPSQAHSALAFWLEGTGRLAGKAQAKASERVEGRQVIGRMKQTHLCGTRSFLPRLEKSLHRTLRGSRQLCVRVSGKRKKGKKEGEKQDQQVKNITSHS